MIVREIITEANPTVTLLLPEEMVGKTVEVIAFESMAKKHANKGTTSCTNRRSYQSHTD